MGKPSAPAPPDYAAGAVAQGQANVDAAVAGTALGTPNQVNPFGSVSWENPGYDAALAEWEAGRVAPGPITDPTGPDGKPLTMFTADAWTGKGAYAPASDYDRWMARKPSARDFTSPGDWTQRSKFSPEIQALFDRVSSDPLAPANLGEGVVQNRDEAEEALYRRATRYLDPQVEQQRQALETRLWDQGIMPGSEAYTYQMSQFDKNTGTSYADARDRAIIGGGTEADRSFAQNLQMYLQKMRERMQPFQEYAAAAQFLPQSGAGSVGVQAAPILQAMGQQHAADSQNYATEAGQYGSTLGAAGQLGLLAYLAGTGGGGAAAAAALSDRRLKSNIVRVATHPLGIGIYEYDIFGERQRGVMADEVEKVLPGAVLTHPSGFKMVNYGLL